MRADEETTSGSDMPASDAIAGADEVTTGEMATSDETSTGDDLAAAADGDMGATTNSWSGEAPGFEASTRDFGSDADVMDDAFATRGGPPEWPTADLVRSDEASSDSAPDQMAASTDIAAAYAAASDEPQDLGDDSDAPIEFDADTTVRAEAVNLTQGGVQSIDATTVTLSQGGAGQVRADEMTVEQGGVGLARVGNLTLGNGASAFAVVADQATVEEGSSTFLVVSRSFTGDVKPTVDWRVAMAFGAGLGLVLSIFRRRR
jgi:hypothetical protein